MSLILVGSTPSTVAPLKLDELVDGVRKDFTDAMHKCSEAGFFRLLITPKRFAYRTPERSSVRVDFQSRRCLHSLQIHSLYRIIAHEKAFKGIGVSFGEKTLNELRVGDHKEYVFMLVISFKVPDTLINSGLLTR